MDPIERLREELSKRQERHERYSLRSYARTLDVSPGLLCGILARKRNLTINLADRFSDRLGWIEGIRKKFLKETLVNNGGGQLTQYKELQSDQFKLISDWYHYGILCLSELATFRYDIPWIAKQLGIGPIQTRSAVERLIKIGLLKEVKGRLVEAADKISSSDGPSSKAVRRYHKQIMKKAIDALEEYDVTERTVRSTMLSISRSQLPKANKLISKFTCDMAKLLEGPKRDDVYVVNVQLFPILKRRSDDETN